jgi:patatin-like phospholipase/acyl hydrolase
MSPYRILSLDGGGIRGVLTAKLLEGLEMAHPGFLSKVDLLAGTSTGGILALGLAVGLAPEEIGRLYEESGTKVFANSLWDDIRDLGMLIGSDYSNEPLKQALLELMGEITLGDLQKRVLVSSFDLDNDPQEPGALRTWKPKFFYNFPGEDSDADEKVVDVALRAQWAPHLISLVMESNVGLADYQCKQVLAKRYLRINPILPKPIGLEEVAQIPLLKEVAEKENLDAAIKWLKRYYKL